MELGIGRQLQEIASQAIFTGDGTNGTRGMTPKIEAKEVYNCRVFRLYSGPRPGLGQSMKVVMGIADDMPRSTQVRVNGKLCGGHYVDGVWHSCNVSDDVIHAGYNLIEIGSDETTMIRWIELGVR